MTGFPRAADALAIVLLCAALPACEPGEPPPAPEPAAPSGAPAAESSAAAAFADPGSCAGCHPAEQSAWTGSHHDLAMQEATPETVLGDFDDATFTAFGVTTRFHRDGERFLVDSEGPDGAMATYEVAYTFGVEPLQQVLLRLPKGHLQAFPIAWDTRRRRWLSLYPEARIPPGDPLHWTGPLQRWNSMCADCHSTDLQRNYDAASASYDTAWLTIDVSCQACHGPAADHVAWAKAYTPGAGAPEAVEARLPVRSDVPGDVAEIETCAPCHSRRHRVSAATVPGAAFLDGYEPELLWPGLYQADGQIEGEVYVYGSFTQSRMHRRGVRCSDCHDPHSLKLRAEGNALCVGCHSPEGNPRFPTLVAKTYDAPEHHFHPPGSPGAACVACHMPSRTYMQVDDRRDHSLRIPRPDLTLSIGTPNACTGCHADRDARWAADFLATRRPADRVLPAHYGEALAAGRAGRPEATVPLVALAADEGAPAIARATAVQMLARAAASGSAEAGAAIEGAAGDADGSVRAAAAGALAAVPPERAVPVLARLVADERAAVRTAAAFTLAGLAAPGLAPEQQRAFDAALDEYRAGQRALADTAEAHLNLAILDRRRGRGAAAEREYRSAIALRPDLASARLDFASFLNGRHRNDEAEQQLREAIEVHEHMASGLADDAVVRPERGELYYSLALVLAEEGRLEESADALGKAADLLPDRARIRYNQGLALQQLGRRDEAEAALLAAERMAPDDSDVQNALAILYAQQGRKGEALRHAERHAEQRPGDPGAERLLQQIRQLPEAQ